MEIVDLIPNVMGNVTILERNGVHILNIPPTMDGMKFRKWLGTPGGILSRDFLTWIREKGDPEYFLVKSEYLKSAIRLIKEDDILHFESLGLIHGKIKDSYYMHLKTVEIDQNIHGNGRYISETIESTDGDETNESEDDLKYQSESLFN